MNTLKKLRSSVEKIVKVLERTSPNDSFSDQQIRELERKWKVK